MKPRTLLALAQALEANCPDVDLVKNDMGNLAIVRDNAYIGHVDLRYGLVEWLADDEYDDSGEDG